MKARGKAAGWLAAAMFLAGLTTAPAQETAVSPSSDLVSEILELAFEDYVTGRRSAEPLAGGTRLVDIVTDKSGTTVLLETEKALLDEFDEMDFEALLDLSRPYFQSGLAPDRVLLRAAGKAGAEFKDLTEYLPPAPPQLEKPEAPVERRLPNSHEGQPQGDGFLAGKSIFLSPGHGWYYSSSSGRWVTQRGLSLGIIEDHANIDFGINWVQRYLRNAGAGVYPVREGDMNTNMVIVDNEDAGYSETGSWQAQSGAGYDGSLRYAATTTGNPTATATFRPTIPESGHYNVYVYYQPAGSTTTSDGSFTINHAGGSTNVRQNMNRDGYTWKYVGRYFFDAGTGGSVVIDNQATGGGNVIADAVRFGGGMGQVEDPDCDCTSGKPMFEESGYYYAGFMGKSDWTSYGTVSAMPSYADWESEGWEDSAYVSMHTNAAGGRGLLMITYGSCWDCWDDNNYAGYPGSREMRQTVQEELLTAIRQGWDASWPLISPISRAYGEVNTSYNNEMPSILIEVGFHDNVTDAAALRDAQFRQLAARGIYKGIVRYFAERDGVTPRYLPETPTHFAAENLGGGGIRLSWSAPPSNQTNSILGDPATGYRVYLGTHGWGFEDGIDVTGNTYTISANDLTPGETYYFRLAATNQGGESFPTETLAVKYRSSGSNPILIVNGFDRLDEPMNVVQDGADRHFLDRMNSYDYVVDYAKAIEAYGESFDSTSNEAVESGIVDLTDYETVIWCLGEESTADDTLSSQERAAVQTFLNGGGNLFISGSELAYDLSQEASSYLTGTLKAGYDGDDANTYAVNGAAGIFADLGSIVFDNGSTIYNVDYPDELLPTGGSQANLVYSGGTNGYAGIQYAGTYKTVVLGFPWEAIVGADKRWDVMTRVLDFFGYSGNEPITDIILEVRDPSGNLTPNPPYEDSAGWDNSSVKSQAPGLSGDGSRYSDSSTPQSDIATMTPTIETAGVYEVWVTWPWAGNSNNVKYTVTHLDGESVVYVDQSPETADQWITLGQYELVPGTGAVSVDESTVSGWPDAVKNKRVYTDAFKWTFLEAIEAPVDEGDVNTDGSVTPLDAQMTFECFLHSGCAPGLNAQAADVCPKDGMITPADAQSVFNLYVGEPTGCE